MVAASGNERGAGAAHATLLVALLGYEHEENLGLRYLLGALHAEGHAGFVAGLDSPRDRDTAMQAVLEQAPTLCGVSIGFRSSARPLLAFAHDLRNAGYRGHICIGGHWATFEYESILRDAPWVDSVARHDGERTICELCDRLDRGVPLVGTQGLAVRQRGIVHVGQARPAIALDELAFPVRRERPSVVAGVRAAPLLGSRGCIGRCSYCSLCAHQQPAGRPHRIRSVDNLLREMGREYHDRGIRLFVFHDDDFVVAGRENRSARLREIGVGLAQSAMHDIGLVVKCRADDLDAEVVDLFRTMGVLRVYVGVDTATPRGIRALRRGMTVEHCHRALELLRESGIFHSFNMLLFHPDATFESLEQELQFLRQHVESPWGFGRVEAYAGSALWKRLRAEGGLRLSDGGWDYDIADRGVEAAFRIVAEVFRTRAFELAGVSNLLASSWFECEVQARFRPWLRRPGDDRAWRRLSAEIATDTLSRLSRVIDRVRRSDHTDQGTLGEFTLSLARETMFADAQFLARVLGIRRETEGREATWPSAEHATLSACPGVHDPQVLLDGEFDEP